MGNAMVAAMNQSFFTLSLGIGAMAIFGSYLEKKRALLGESVTVAALDTFVAITSGLIIFPACFAYGVNPDSGPNLIFITLPNIFTHMPGGRVWGSCSLCLWLSRLFPPSSRCLRIFWDSGRISSAGAGEGGPGQHDSDHCAVHALCAGL